MGTGAVLGVDGCEYCLGRGGYCVGFFAGGNNWCCVVLGQSLSPFLSFLLLRRLAIFFGGVWPHHNIFAINSFETNEILTSMRTYKYIDIMWEII